MALRAQTDINDATRNLPSSAYRNNENVEAEQHLTWMRVMVWTKLFLTAEADSGSSQSQACKAGLLLV